MPVTIYTAAFCPYCIGARWLLRRRGIAFEERRLRRAERGQLAPLGGGLTFPQIVFGERVVDGYDGLRALDRRGELERLAAG